MTETAYIQSGAIEAYLLGTATEEEMQMHLEMEAKYPAIKAARLQVEMEIETAMLRQATPASHKLQTSLQQTLEKEGLLTNPASAAGTKPILAPAPKPIRWFRTALAASVLLLMGSIILNFWYWSQYTDYAKRYQALLGEQNTLLAKTNALQAGLQMIKSPDMQPVVLKSLPGNATMQATVFYSPQNSDVYLVVNNLPAPAPGKQYQLWAEVGGKMVDAGLLNWETEMMPVKMRNISNAAAFAISLETIGGSQAPTPKAVMVAGKV